MRFRLTLAVDRSKGNHHILPINYQYELSSWIYHTIHHGNPEFSKWLHDSGLTNQNRRFKLFTFSNLRLPFYTINGDRLEIRSDSAGLVISFYLPEAADPFIAGIFKDVQFRIGDRISAVDFCVSQIEKLPDIKFSETMQFATISPLVISRNETNGKKYAHYLSPEDPDFTTVFMNNLINKYLALVAAGNISVSEARESADMTFKCTANPRQKLIMIKANTASEVSLRGYLFNFELKAPEELMKIGYYGGFGEKNSLGFGCCEVVNINH
jgi:CRISPR-associated endoribonuclease Cas6